MSLFIDNKMCKKKRKIAAETAKKRAKKLTCFKNVFSKTKVTPNIKLPVLFWH